MEEIIARPGVEIDLGHWDENLARCVVFDISHWRRIYGEGGVQLLHQRYGDSTPYPCVVEVIGTQARWTVTETDVALPGRGVAELQYIFGEGRVKTDIYHTRVRQAMSNVGPVPDAPEQSWVDQVLARGQAVFDAEQRVQILAGQAQDAKDEAEQILDEVLESEKTCSGQAIASAASALAAEKAASSAEASAEGAADNAEIAADNATAAAVSAGAAADSAKEAADSAAAAAGSALSAEKAAADSAASAGEAKSEAYAAAAARVSEHNTDTAAHPRLLSELSRVEMEGQKGLDDHNADRSAHPYLLAGMLPEVTAGDNGKVLSVSGGAWAAAEPSGGVTSWDDLTDTPFTKDYLITSVGSVSVASFAMDDTYGAYAKSVSLPDLTVTAGVVYVVEWDGTSYPTTAQDAGGRFSGALLLGNGSNYELKGKGEPFAIVFYPDTSEAVYLALNDTEDGGEHDVTVSYTMGYMSIGANVPLTLPADPSENMQAATKQYVDAAVQEAGGSGSGVSSWNDLTDKPFREEPEVVTVFAEQELGEPTNQSLMGWTVYLEPAPFSLTAGATYRVMFDAEEYVCTAQASTTGAEGVTLLGNGTDWDYSGNGEPFCMMVLPDKIAVLYPEDTEAVIHKIAIYQDAAVEILDNKCLEFMESTAGTVGEVILPEVSATSVLDATWGYCIPSSNAPFTFVVGETYVVVWDGAEYTCEAMDGSVMAEGAVYIGNAEPFMLSGNGEPFALALVGTSFLVACLTDTEPTEHSVMIRIQGKEASWNIRREYLPVAAAVDLTAYESDGVIVETYPDGSTVTYTVVFDDGGNPVSITDSAGNTTTLTW